MSGLLHKAACVMWLDNFYLEVLAYVSWLVSEFTGRKSAGELRFNHLHVSLVS